MKKYNVIKSKKGQQLNQREVRMINDCTVEGLLLFDVKYKNSNVILTYNTDGLVPLRDFLKFNEMSKKLFVILLRNIVIGLKSIDANKFSRDLISLDLCTTYVDPASWRVYLMYIPLQPYEVKNNLKNYLQDFVSVCSFVLGENLEYVQSFVENLNTSVVYTANNLEEYCNLLSEQFIQNNSNRVNKQICPICSAKIIENEEYCPFCGGNINGHPTLRTQDLTADDGVHYQNQHQSNYSQDEISVNENGVVTIFKGSQEFDKSVWLEDRSKSGKISISKFPFRIGKSNELTDLQINNSAVSRKHADILKENGKYFIVDMGSTNGTYLSNKRIQPGVKELLNDGMIVKFANAEFKIHID